MSRIVILTGSELRHEYFRKKLATENRISVAATFCEGLERSHSALVERDTGEKDMRRNHLLARTQSEKDFFEDYCDAVADQSKPRFIPKGAVNDDSVAQAIKDLRPDILVAYGCSLIKTDLLHEFQGRFLNVHLGLSPYYRGSGTNFWPLVENEPEFVGATFMHIDEGIDTGNIIHQIRARYVWGDTPSMIGNRLIRDMTCVYADVIARLKQLSPTDQPDAAADGKLYKAKDFSEASVVKLYRQFEHGLVEDYLENEEARNAQAPIVQHPELRAH